MPSGEARGIVINNPSGSWLTVYPLFDQVPPYTLAWSRDFPNAVASATVRYTLGPAGQQSSIEGTPMTVWLDSDPVGASGGIATPGSSFRPLSTTTQDQLTTIAMVAGIATDLVAAQANRVIRLYSFRIGYQAEGPPVATTDMGIQWIIQPNPFPIGGQALAFGDIEPVRGYDDVDFTTNPRDMPFTVGGVTSAFALFIRPRWPTIANVLMRYHIRFSIL